MSMTIEALADFMQQAFPQVARDFLVHEEEGELVLEMRIEERHLRPGGQPGRVRPQGPPRPVCPKGRFGGRRAG